MDINTNLGDTEKLIEQLRDFRAKHPDAAVFVSSLDIAGAVKAAVESGDLDDQALRGAEQLVLADKCDPMTLFVVAQIALHGVQSLAFQLIKQHPEALIEVGMMAAAAKAANSIIEQVSRSQVIGVASAEPEEETPHDGIGVPVGRA